MKYDKKKNMPGMTDGTFCMKDSSESSKRRSVGMQGAGGPMGGQSVAGVNNPKGIEPKKIGGGRMPMMQGPVEGKVGK